MVPAILSDVLDDVVSHPRLDKVGPWTAQHNKSWSLLVRARLSVSHSEYVQSETLWHIVVGPNQPEDGVYIYPDAVDGLKTTFPHQDYNGHDASDVPWRLGKPCLERATVAFKQYTWTDEPIDLHRRILWKLDRLLSWIDAAASETLLAKGDPLELPAFPHLPSVPLIGFSEIPEDLSKWSQATATWGFAKLGSVSNAQSTSFVSEFHAPDGSAVHRAIWGAKLAATDSSSSAIWIRVPTLPVLRPWQAPRTWIELRDCLAHQQIDLETIIALAGAKFRRGLRRVAKPTLLLGFPLADTVGAAPERFHWLAVGRVPITSRKERRKGFRPREENHREWDKEIVRSNKELDWVRTENWASDQVRSRGEAEQPLREKRVLMLGAGALGSVVAENLVRMGVRQIGIVDSDTLNVGNLSRHALSMSSAGKPKAEAMVEFLNDCAPDINACAFNVTFPPTKKDVALAMRAYDVIVDCTASDRVLDAMAAFDWQSEKLFISLSITWEAEGLLVFGASEAIFPAYEAKLQFAKSPAPDFNLGNTRTEGIGCWHGVFPATADDMALWGAISCKFIRTAVLQPGSYSHYYKQNGGTVELHREQ